MINRDVGGLCGQFGSSLSSLLAPRSTDCRDMNCTFLLVLLCVVAALAQDADYPEGEAPRPRNSLLRRGALARTQANKATPSTTTTQAPKEAPVEELAEDDEELEEEIEEEDPATTTEASRRLKAGVVRPFRSNDDLLAALKRRRAEAANGKTHHKEESSGAPAAAESQASADHSLPSKSSQAGRRRYNSPAKNEPAAAAEETPATPKAVRSRFSGRSLKRASSTQADGEIAGLESNQESVEVKPKPAFRPGQRRF